MEFVMNLADGGGASGSRANDRMNEGTAGLICMIKV